MGDARENDGTDTASESTAGSRPPVGEPGGPPVPGPLTSVRQRKRDETRPSIWVGYGKLLKKFREQAGLTQEQLAHRVGYSTELVGSIEQGRRPAKETFTIAAERELPAGGVLKTLQEDVDFAKLPAFFQDIALIEGEAVSRSDYSPQLVPGLLQTEEYARAVIEGHCPPLEEETIENYLDARLSRQKLLTRVPLIDFSFIVGEEALRNPVRGREAMRKQCAHLLKLNKLRNVAIQVMPSGSGFHPGLNGPMVILETTHHKRFGYVESQDIGQVVSDPSKASTIELRYGKLRSRALSTEASAAFIEQLAGGR